MDLILKGKEKDQTLEQLDFQVKTLQTDLELEKKRKDSICQDFKRIDKERDEWIIKNRKVREERDLFETNNRNLSSQIQEQTSYIGIFIFNM